MTEANTMEPPPGFRNCEECGKLKLIGGVCRVSPDRPCDYESVKPRKKIINKMDANLTGVENDLETQKQLREESTRMNCLSLATNLVRSEVYLGDTKADEKTDVIALAKRMLNFVKKGE